MTVSITADNNGQTCVVDLADVTGLDALVYRRDVGEELDHRLGALLAVAPDDSAGWCLADRTVIVWLWTRHNVDADARLAEVAASVHLMPSTPPVPQGAGGTDAPEVPA